MKIIKHSLNDSSPRLDILEVLFEGRSKYPRYQRILCIDKANGNVWVCSELVGMQAQQAAILHCTNHLQYHDYAYIPLSWIISYYDECNKTRESGVYKKMLAEMNTEAIEAYKQWKASNV